MKKPKQHIRGISLIELMVVLCILSILAAISFPAYTSQVLKTNRMDAKRILSQIQLVYERYYVDNNNVYPTAGISAAYSALSLGSPPTSNYYTFSTTTSSASYTLSASVAGNQVSDTDCTRFYLDNLGNRTATSSTCW